MIKSAHHTG